ncbi:hypothetical protein CBS101457_001061 [Exobasidium rhododendri]|nr:hypothetical protein CBS101457_001061 [Exobasidium rhododendri]
MRFTLSASLFAFAVAGASAQLSGLPSGLVSNLSTSCLGGVASLLSNSDLNSCLHLTQALTTFGAAGSNDSLVDPLNTYLSSQICPNAACSSSTLKTANTSVVQACSTDLASENNATVPEVLVYLFTNYDTFRTAACLEDTTKGNQLCLTQTLSNLQTTTNMNVSLSALTALTSSSEEALITAFAANTTALCTDCNKALLTTFAPSFKSSSSNVTTQLGSIFTQKCGTSSIGTIPTSIRASASGNSTSATSTTNSTGSSKGGSASADGVASGRTASVAVVALGALTLTGFVILL